MSGCSVHGVITRSVIVIVLALLCSDALAQVSPATSRFSRQHDAPIVLDGAQLLIKEDDKDAARLTRKVNLPTPGVWYVWLQITSGGDFPALLTWDLDGKQLLRSARKEILIPPHLAKQWINHTRFPGFKIEVHVDEPGEHEFGITLIKGDVKIERIALTLFHSARPRRNTLDHAGDPAAQQHLGDFTARRADPGLGRTTFPLGEIRADGFRKDWKSPEFVVAGQRYYVDGDTGDDGDDGTSQQKAWRTFDRANATTFAPGDAILLKRGSSFTGGLAPRGSGSPEKPITVAAYGEGARPRIDGRDKPGFALTDQSHWIVQDLEISNHPDFGQSGIAILASKDVSPQPKGIKVLNCIVYDTGDSGIHVGSKHEQGNGYDGVVIENCMVFWTANDGVIVNGNDQNGCRNAIIRHCTAFSNPGMAGMWICGGQNGLIERCLAYNNACVNIWTWNSINVTIRHCEAFRGRPQRDAGGFDIDWGCEACTIEYCYAHHNEGVGFLVMGSGTKPYRGFPVESRYNLMRYCVSEYDNPGIGTCGTLQQTLIHNNTVYVHGPEHYALTCEGWPELPDKWTGGGWPSETSYVNNILVAAGGAVVLLVDDLGTSQRNVFDHNVYWRVDGSAGPLVLWGGSKSGDPVKFWQGLKEGVKQPTPFSSLAAFRDASGQERHGLEADPKLRAAGAGGHGRQPLDAYRLQPGSPAIGAGRGMELPADWLKARRAYLTDTGAASTGIPMEPDPTPRDFWNNPVPATQPAVGADQPK